jgi:8-oxo-dGTP diphosphatase
VDHNNEEALKKYNVKDYVTPDGYTSDIAVFTIISEVVGAYKPPNKTLKIMLIKRAEVNAEGKPNIEGGKWALPGGFIQPDETAYEAASRELEEETNVSGLKIKHFGTFDKPGRDPRGWIIANAHYAIVLESELKKRKAADDASDVALFSMAEVKNLELAFDHKEIIEEAMWFIKKDMALTTLAKNFLPKEFVLSELQRVLLTVMNDPWIRLDAQFYRKAPGLPFIEKVISDGVAKKTNTYSKIPAQVYKFNDFEPFVSIYNAKY